MYLEPSQVYTGNITRLKCNHVLPERLWGTRKGMIQLAAQALDLEFLRQLSLRVQALTRGGRRQEVHPQTMAENQIPTKSRNLEAPVSTSKGTKICGLYASGQENSALLCWICLWGCYYANCWQVILDCLGFVFVFCTLPGIRSSQPGRCMSKVMPKPVCPIQQSQRYSTLWGHGSVHRGGGICFISRMLHYSRWALPFFGTSPSRHEAVLLHKDISLQGYCVGNRPLNICRKIFVSDVVPNSR